MEKWWAWQGLNLRPLRCQHSALPLSYTPTEVSLQARWPALENGHLERAFGGRKARQQSKTAVGILGLEHAVHLHHQVLEVERLGQQFCFGCRAPALQCD